MAVYNWYFSQSGNDVYGNGTINNPWKTLTKAQTQINLVNTNDTANLFFKRGDTWTINTAAVSTTICYGINVRSTDPIVHINAYGYGSLPIFDGLVTKFSSAPIHNTIIGPLRWNNIFEFHQDNCSVKNITINNIYGIGIQLGSNIDYADNFTAEGIEIINFGGRGITASNSYGTQDTIVTKCLLHTGQQLSRFKKDGAGGAAWAAAINFAPTPGSSRNPSGNVCSYNVVYDIYGEGLSDTGVTYEYNVIGDTASIAIYPAPQNNDAQDTIIRYNLIIQSSSSIYKNLAGGLYHGIIIADENNFGINTDATIEIYGNIVINRNRGIGVVDWEHWNDPWGEVRIYNNTVIDSASYNFYIAQHDNINPGGGFVYNNLSILYDRTSSTHALDAGNPPNLSDYWTISNNLFWTKGSPTIVDVDWQKNAIIADPKLTNAHLIDFIGQTGPTYYKDIKFSDLYPLPGSALLGSGKPLGVGFDNAFLTKGSDFSTLPDSPKFNLALQPEYGGWDIGAIVPSDGINLCDGVVCTPVCLGDDLWSQRCDPVTGDCILYQLLESNSATCLYDPCEGVVCPTICLGDDLWSQRCDPATGDCILDQLLESNSATCFDDPCEGVSCPTVCIGDDLWSQQCDPATGNCVLHQLLQPDSLNCTIPEKIPTDESTILNYILLGGLGIMGLGMLLLAKKR